MYICTTWGHISLGLLTVTYMIVLCRIFSVLAQKFLKWSYMRDLTVVSVLPTVDGGGHAHSFEGAAVPV